MKTGEQMDFSSEPLYLEDLIDIVRAYTEAASEVNYRGGATGPIREAVLRKYAIVSAGQAAGRPSELAFILTDVVRWDSFYRQLFPVLPQSKTSKIKLIAFVAGN